MANKMPLEIEKKTITKMTENMDVNVSEGGDHGVKYFTSKLREEPHHHNAVYVTLKENECVLLQTETSQNVVIMDFGVSVTGQTSTLYQMSLKASQNVVAVGHELCSTEQELMANKMPAEQETNVSDAVSISYLIINY